MNNNLKIVLGVVAAAAAGVTIGMLLAPEKGSDLRRGIRDRIDEFGNKVSDLIDGAKSQMRQVAEELNTDVAALKNDARTTVEHGKKIVS